MHKLLAKQLAKAKGASGELDLDALLELVSAAYDETTRDRDRNARSIALMAAELEHSQAHLLDAFDVIPEGVAMFDAEDRLVLWNKPYADIYGTPGVELAAGRRFEDILRDGLAAGAYQEAKGREEEWLTERLAKHALPSSMTEQRLADGRWVRVEERRTADGGSIGVRLDITDLKRREASFRLLFESNPVPMWVYCRETLRFFAVNEAALARYGYSREQFLAMTMIDLHKSIDLQRLRRAANEGVTGRTTRHLKADGTEIDVELYSQLLTYDSKPAGLTASIDITDRKQAEDRVRETREFLDNIIDNVPITVTVKDAADSRYVLVNRAAEEFLGRPRNEIVGRTPYEVFNREAADAIVARDRKLIEIGTEYILDDRPLHDSKSGNRFITSKRRTLPDADGKPRYLLGVVQDVTELKLAEQRIAHLANHDSLTDLPNRAAFETCMLDAFAFAQDAGGQFGVICIDFDRFKAVNDVFGHGVGDAVLQETGRRLKAAAGDALLARVGGDEFTLLVTQGSQPDATEAVAERLLAAMREPITVGENQLSLGISIGAAIYPIDGEDRASLLSNADAALYRAKAAGRGTIRFFEAEMDQHLRDRRLLQHELRMAVDGEQLALHYQPQARVDRSIVGFEALLRWNNPTRGIVTPGVFVPLAEESGIVLQMGEWALRAACREAASWPTPLNVAVNLSPVQFQQGDLPALVHAILLETGLAANRLELEVTEGVLMHDFDRALAMLRRIKALGVRIAMDDFGTGYSSLSYLQSFPFDKIKIDRSFVTSLRHSPQSAAIVRAVIGLGRSLELPVTAEGVETEDQLAFLANEGCGEVQGFLLGRPQPIEVYANAIGRARRMDQAAAAAGQISR